MHRSSMNWLLLIVWLSFDFLVCCSGKGQGSIDPFEAPVGDEFAGDPAKAADSTNDVGDDSFAVTIEVLDDLDVITASDVFGSIDCGPTPPDLLPKCTPKWCPSGTGCAPGMPSGCMSSSCSCTKDFGWTCTPDCVNRTKFCIPLPTDAFEYADVAHDKLSD